VKPTLIYGIYAFVLYILIAWQYRYINKSILLNPLLIQILTFTISFVSIIFLYNTGYIDKDIFLILFIQCIMYTITFVMAPYFIKKEYLNLDKFMEVTEFDLQIGRVVFFVNILIALFYILLFWSIYSDGNERLNFNRDFRALSLFTSLFSFWAISLCSAIYSKTKIKEYFLYVLISLILIAFMGSKGLMFLGILIFIFLYLQCNSLNLIYLLVAIFIIFLSVFIPTQIMYGNALDILIDRVFMSGDIYIYSFVLGDYKDLIGYYEPLSYFTHPYSSLFGVRGYDFPLGSKILETANIGVSGAGPQDHMTILAITLFSDSYIEMLLFTLFICFIIIFFMKFSFYIFSLTKFCLSIRIIVFILLYIQIINIFVGINAFSFNIILIILSICIYLFFVFLNIVTYKTK